MDYLSGPKSGDIVPLRGRRTLAQGGRGMTTEKIYSHMAKREAEGLYFSIIGVVKASTPLLDLQVPGCVCCSWPLVTEASEVLHTGLGLTQGQRLQIQAWSSRITVSCPQRVLTSLGRARG